MKWIYPKVDSALVDQLKQDHGFPTVLAELLADRLKEDPSQLEDFLQPKLMALRDPFEITQMDLVVDRLIKAIRNQEKILIYGDYDVDGVTSTALLCDFMGRYELKPDYFVPNRVEEGYGLSEEGLSRAIGEKQPDLLIAVDCGTSSHELVESLRSQGIEVIIIDHHTSKDSLPQDCLFINPKVWDSESEPWYDLCTVGLVFKVIHGLLKVLREQEDLIAEKMDPREFLDLVALGTVADLVTLRGENRIFVKHGLNELNRRQRVGLASLIAHAGLADQKEIKARDLGFRLGPRINAGGRISDATQAIELFLTQDTAIANRIAGNLERHNRGRQDIEKTIVKQAEAMAHEQSQELIYILHNNEWHSGVVGIVASRISRSKHVPTLILGLDENSGLLKGSGRSIDGINLVEALKPCEDLLEQWGGHPMAVGLTIHPDKLEAFKNCLRETILENTQGQLPEATLKVSAKLEEAEVNESLLESVQGLEPFGQENPEPTFSISNVQVLDMRTMGQGHLSFRLSLTGAGSLRGVYWNGANKRPPSGVPVDLAFRLNWNEFRGKRSLQLTLMDWRES